MEVGIEQVFQVFLAAGDRRGFAELEGDLLKLLEAEFALLDVAAEAHVVGVVTGGDVLGELAFGEDAAGGGCLPGEASATPDRSNPMPRTGDVPLDLRQFGRCGNVST